MKKPTAEQLEQLTMLQQYKKVSEYLTGVEVDYMERIVTEPNSDKVRQLQGSLFVLRELKKHINHEQR